VAVEELLEHVEARDDLAPVATAALADFFAQGRPPASRELRPGPFGYGLVPEPSADERLWDEVVVEVLAFVARRARDPDPELLAALGRSFDSRIVGPLCELVLRWLEEPVDEEALWQAMLALTNQPRVPTSLLRAVAASDASPRARRLAQRRIELLAELG